MKDKNHRLIKKGGEGKCICLFAIISGLMFNGCGLEDCREEVFLQTQIAPIKYDRDAIVTVMSDDGRYETGVMLDELAAKYHIRVTVSGVVTTMKPHLRDWKKLEKKGNVDLISHSYTHYTMSEEVEIPESDFEREITDSIRFYKRHFKTDQIAFTPPENQMCERGYVILADNGIRAMRQGMRGYNVLEPQTGHEMAQWYNLCTFGIGDVNTTEERNAWIDEAVENNAWLIEMWHDVTEDGKHGSYQEIAYNMADEHLNYIADRQSDGDIWVASMVDATKYLTEKEYASVSAVYDGSKIKVSLKCNSEELPSKIYNEPLTVKVMLPEDAVEFTKAVSTNTKNDIRILMDEGRSYLELEIVPNNKDVIIKPKK